MTFYIFLKIICDVVTVLPKHVNPQQYRGVDFKRTVQIDGITSN